MFHMTNDSNLFLKTDELKKQGFKPAGLNRWRNAAGLEAVPLYEGKMVQMYDHRAADVVVNTANLMRAAQPEAISQREKASSEPLPGAAVLWHLRRRGKHMDGPMVHRLQGGHRAKQYANHDCRRSCPGAALATAWRCCCRKLDTKRTTWHGRLC